MDSIELTDELDVKNTLGRGYRNISYVSTRNGGNIVLFGYDKANIPQTYIIPHRSHLYYRVKYETPLKDIYDNYLAVKYFNSSYERYKFIQSLNDSIPIVEALKPEEEFLHEAFREHMLNDDFNTQNLRIHFLDIEIAVGNSFPTPEKAEYPINIITIYDTYNKIYYSWILGEVKNTFENKSEHIIFQFSSEYNMLSNFSNWVACNYPDVITGWNTYYFDVPYVINRLIKLLPEEEVKQISPLGKIKMMETKDVKPKQYYKIAGVSQLDLLLLYRDKFQVRQALDGGYGLDNVCEIELNENKHHYSGTIKDFYQRDFQRFFEYNVRDVELTVMLEQKCQLITLARKTVSNGLTELETVYGSIAYIVGSLMEFSLKDTGKILPSYRNEEVEKEEYKGGYVFPVQSGFYNNGTSGIDVGSLYPNTIISINCSPETKVGQLIPITEEPGSYYIKGKTVTKKINQDTLDLLCKTTCILSKNNTLFLKHEVKHGIIPKWCEHYYDERKRIKKLEHKEKIDAKKALYHVTQVSIKNMINSLYGIMANKYSAIFDIDLAQSITLNGQYANKSAAAYIKRRFKEMYNLDDSFDPIIAGDTDSSFLNIAPLTEKYCNKYGIVPVDIRAMNKDQLRDMINELDSFINDDVNKYIGDHINEVCFTNRGHHIKYVREYVASEGMFFKKKHYLVHKIEDEGDFVDKFKYSGISVKKAEIPSEMKHYLKQIYERTCREHWTYNTYSKFLSEVFDKFKTYDIKDISIFKGYNTEKETTGFLTSAKGTGGHAKAALYYNDLIKKLKIDSKYETINVGDKIRYCYIYNNNEYGIDIIAFKNVCPEEFKQIFQVNYELMFQKIFLKPLEGYIDAMKFPEFNPTNEMLFNIAEL